MLCGIEKFSIKNELIHLSIIYIPIIPLKNKI
jgi:hypothetical protein